MAKRRGRRDNQTQNPIANDPLSVLVSRPLLSPLTLIEDRRLYHPDGPERPVLSFDGRPSSFTLEPELNRNVGRLRKARTNSTKARLIFQAPQTVMEPVLRGRGPVDADTAVCVRRKSRREVLFAKGKGGSRHRRRVRRNRNSDIGC